jgi:hypothetical protein
MLFVATFLIFGYLGDIRSGRDNIIAVAAPSFEYPDWLPSAFIWFYLYVSTPLNNVNFNIDLAPNYFPLETASTFIPSFAREGFVNALGGSRQWDLVSETFNVSSLLQSVLSDFGVSGAMVFMLVCGVGFSRLVRRSRVSAASFFAVIVLLHGLALSFFANLLFHLVFMFQIVVVGWVVAAYNAERTIETCLASVALQTLAPVEVLVVDDASRDDTASAVNRCAERLAMVGVALKYFRLARNSGPSVARNKGILEATGSHIAFLDADDIWRADKLAIVDRFAGDTTAGLICHAYTEAATLGSADVAPHVAKPISVHSMLLSNPAQTSSVVMRRQPDLRFDETMRYCEDHDLWIRIAERSAVLQLVGSPLTRLGRPQLSAGGLSGNRMRMRAGEVRVYYKFCQRARLSRAWALPCLVLFSLAKHLYSGLRR